MSKVYDDVKGLTFLATGTCADVYLTPDKSKVVKVVKLKNEHEFENKKRAIKSIQAEHEIINLIGEYKSYGVSISNKYGYITMDRVPGKSLSDIMDYNTYLEIDPDDVISIIKDWTKQIKVLHDHGICHYSLHRSNIFIDKNKGYIIDFGNAVLDSDFVNDYKYMMSSDKVKSNNRGIYHIHQDFRFYLKNCKRFVENIHTTKGSEDYRKMKSVYDYIKKELRILKYSPKRKYNYNVDFYKFLSSL